jgi:hypothetical protein
MQARDASRIADMEAIYDALVLFELDYGYAPTTSYDSNSIANYDVSFDEEFLSVLVDEGYLARMPLDPIPIRQVPVLVMVIFICIDAGVMAGV